MRWMRYGKRQNNMNVPNKQSIRRLLIGVSCLALSLNIAINTAYAVPCFDNAQSAYNYLLTQETAQTQTRTQSTININRATEGELTLLHGIGSSKAQAIILYREMFGRFKTVDELTKVKGIGAKTVEKNRRRLTVQD